MTKTIIDLWNGNVAPGEQCGVHDREGDHLLGLMERNENALCGELSEEQRAVFQKYVDCSVKYLIRMQELAFYEDFCLGSKLITESLL